MGQLHHLHRQRPRRPRPPASPGGPQHQATPPPSPSGGSRGTASTGDGGCPITRAGCPGHGKFVAFKSGLDQLIFYQQEYDRFLAEERSALAAMGGHCGGNLTRFGACPDEIFGIQTMMIGTRWQDVLIPAALMVLPVGEIGDATLAGASRLLFGSKAARVFWQGGDVAKDTATGFAVANGATTIGMTVAGKVLEVAISRIPYSVAKPFWNGASWLFARTSTGQVDVFINMARPNPASIWAKTELPTLIANQNVSDIVFHLVSSGTR